MSEHVKARNLRVGGRQQEFLWKWPVFSAFLRYSQGAKDSSAVKAHVCDKRHAYKLKLASDRYRKKKRDLPALFLQSRTLGLLIMWFAVPHESFALWWKERRRGRKTTARRGKKKTQNHHVLRSRNRKFQTLRRARYDSCRVMFFLIWLF